MSDSSTSEHHLNPIDHSLPVVGPLSGIGKRWLPSSDSFGVMASVACAIHCAAMPFVIGLLPMLGLEFLARESFHKWMAGVCLLIALAAFVPGWRSHGRILPASIAISGLALISLSAFGFLGDCCTSCEANGQEHQGLIANEVFNGEPVCSQSCCAHQETEIDPVALGSLLVGTQTPQADTDAGSFLTDHAVWWTPLGGLFLIYGHLLNRRFLCDGVCCGMPK